MLTKSIRAYDWRDKTAVHDPGGGGRLNVEGMGMCRPYGWALGPKFSKQGSIFRQIFLQNGWVIQKLAKNSQKLVVFRQNSS